MVRKNLVLVIMIIASIIIMPNVKAEVKENAYTDEKCTISEEWKERAKTGYRLNKEKGIYELNNVSVKESIITAQAGEVVYGYEIGENGKELILYIPNYNNIVEQEAGREILSKMGIITTADCVGTLEVRKTVVGETEEEEEIKEEIKEGKYIAEEKEETLENKIQVPNTASIRGVIGVAIGIALIIGSILFVLQKQGIIEIKKIFSSGKSKKGKKMSLIIVLALMVALPVKAAVEKVADIRVLQPSNMEAESLVIKWESGYTGGSYTVEVYNSNKGERKRFSNNVKEYTMQRVKHIE